MFEKFFEVTTKFGENKIWGDCTQMPPWLRDWSRGAFGQSI